MRHIDLMASAVCSALAVSAYYFAEQAIHTLPEPVMRPLSEVKFPTFEPMAKKDALPIVMVPPTRAMALLTRTTAADAEKLHVDLPNLGGLTEDKSNIVSSVPEVSPSVPCCVSGDGKTLIASILPGEVGQRLETEQKSLSDAPAPMLEKGVAVGSAPSVKDQGCAVLSTCGSPRRLSRNADAVFRN
jgi:hypothetical protein